MTDEKDRDKKRSAWNQAAAGDEKKLGLSADVLRKLKQMNPSIADGASTADFMKKVQGELRPQAHRGSSEAIAQQLVQLKSEVASKRAKVADEIRKLELSVQTTLTEARDKLIAALLRVDPNVTSPVTRQALEDHDAFLKEIGFSMAVLIERQKRGG